MYERTKIGVLDADGGEWVDTANAPILGIPAGASIPVGVKVSDKPFQVKYVTPVIDTANTITTDVADTLTIPVIFGISLGGIILIGSAVFLTMKYFKK